MAVVATTREVTGVTSEGAADAEATARPGVTDRAIGATGTAHFDGAEAASVSRSDTMAADAAIIGRIAGRVGGSTRDH